MSKNLRKKALAFGSMFGLAVSGLTGVPAQADANGPLTLLPDGGTASGATYTSIIGAGITLTSEIDFNKSTCEDGPDSLQAYKIENPGEALLTILVAETDEWSLDADGDYLEFDSDGVLTSGFDVDGEIDTPFDEGYSISDDDGFPQGLDTWEYDRFRYNEGSSDNVDGAEVIQSDAATIVVYAGLNCDLIAPIFIDAPTETSTVKVKVTSFVDSVYADIDAITDTDDRSLFNELGTINNGEYRSKTQEVTLLPATAVSYTTTMSSATTREDSLLRATVAMGSGVNKYAIANSYQFGAVFYKDGVAIANGFETWESNVVSGNVDALSYYVDPVTGALTADGLFPAGADLTSGVYSARSVFGINAYNTGVLIDEMGTYWQEVDVKDPDIFVGARSAVLDLRDGTNTTVESAEPTFTESNNLVADGYDAIVRAGTKAVTVTGQLLEADNDDYKAAGVRVRATVTGVALDADSEVTVTGSTTKIVEADDSIVIFGFTNANGQFPITINSTTGEDGDVVTVDFAALNSDGIYVSEGTGSVAWQAAVIDDLLATPSEYLTGETVNVTLTVVDQFGVGIDSTENGRVSLRVDAYVDGAVKTSTYSETKATTSGAASFSFKNFATAGSNQEIQVQILEASLASSETPYYFTVYNNVATSSIAVADQFEARVQYVDFVTGKLTDPAVAKAATDAGIIDRAEGEDKFEFANIVGTVLDANNAGQPGLPVTVAASGVLFHDAETNTLAKDSITVFSNAQGFFDVQAFVQKVNTAGATVTITAGGKTATTKLRSYLDTTISEENLKLSWVLPTPVVKDTTYLVTVKLTDVWGNPVRTVSQEVDGPALGGAAEGSLRVNGVETVNRNFSATGEATFYIRSVPEVGGPGSLAVELDDVVEYVTGKTGETGIIDGTQGEYDDVLTTSWDESDWAGALSTTINVLDVAPVTGKVNVGSFNGKLVVYASGLQGSTISWKVGGVWGKQVATSNFARFDRPTPRRGVTVTVDIYVNGVKQLTKSVVTR